MWFWWQQTTLSKLAHLKFFIFQFKKNKRGSHSPMLKFWQISGWLASIFACFHWVLISDVVIQNFGVMKSFTIENIQIIANQGQNISKKKCLKQKVEILKMTNLTWCLHLNIQRLTLYFGFPRMESCIHLVVLNLNTPVWHHVILETKI